MPCHNLRSGKKIQEPKRDVVITLEKKGLEEEDKVEKDLHKNKQKVKEAIPPSRESTPVVPFPLRLKRSKLNQHFAKFLDMFKKPHINIPFSDALEQMPSYVRFMKNILANKKNLGEYETITVFEKCSAILQKKLPPKLKDLESFNIPCSFGM